MKPEPRPWHTNPGAFGVWVNKTPRAVNPTLGGQKVAYWPPGAKLVVQNKYGDDAAKAGCVYMGPTS